MEKTGRCFFLTQSGLRILGFAATLTAIILMVTSNQTVEIFGFQMFAKYSYSLAFKFFVGVNIASALFYTLSLFLLYTRRHANSANRYFILFLSDFFAAVLGVAGSAAACAIGYLGRYGNSHSNWMPICDYVGIFCKRVTISLIFACLSNFISLVLTVWSAFSITKANN